MNYIATTLNFLKVHRSDTFDVTFTIGDAYDMTGARVKLIVKPVGDVPESPVLSFDSDNDDITITGQNLRFFKQPTDMNVRPGRFIHEIQFIKSNVTSTPYSGIFEIL
jgi:hypothetical protein